MSIENPNQVVEKKVPKTEQSSLAYIIALITLGAAFGNMFMAGKIRNVMKMEMPKASAAGARAGHANPNPGTNTGSSGEYATGSNSSHQRWSQQQHNSNNSHHQHSSHSKPHSPILYLDPKISQHLVTLGFSPEVNQLVHSYSEADIKKRYRELVLQYHPDRIVIENENDLVSIEKKETFTKKFQLITQSYQYLIDDIHLRQKRQAEGSSPQK